MALRLLDPMARPERPGSNCLCNWHAAATHSKPRPAASPASDRRIDQAKPGQSISEPGPVFPVPDFFQHLEISLWMSPDWRPQGRTRNVMKTDAIAGWGLALCLAALSAAGTVTG